jgi:aryl-alcohol dehydrogenase-like predicted oxidoreductase
MLYKKYGNTGLEVSAIGMGCMRYDEQDVLAGNFEKCAELPLYALENGINYFDTAPFYCHDKSETITGIALSQVNRKKYFVSSKANLGTTGKVVNAGTFRSRLETTLKRLKVDYLDIYHLWCMLSLEAYERQSEALYDFFCAGAVRWTDPSHCRFISYAGA